MNKWLILTFSALLSFSNILPEGFVAGTQVKTPNGYAAIDELKIGNKVICYDLKGQCVEREVTGIQRKITDKLLLVKIADTFVIVDHDHKFFQPHRSEFTEIKDLNPGAVLISNCRDFVVVDSIYQLDQSAYVYDIAVDEHHNFCVTKKDVIVHNPFPVVIGGGIAYFFGQGGGAALAWWGGISLLGGVAKVTYDSIKEQRREERMRSYSERMNDAAEKRREEASSGTVEQTRAPGAPTEEDGFIPKKKWDGQKVPNPNGRGYGFPDEKGSVWIPTGRDGHRGPHWDVQHPDGSYDNVMPGGKKLGGNAKNKKGNRK